MNLFLEIVFISYFLITNTNTNNLLNIRLILKFNIHSFYQLFQDINNL